MSRHKGPYVISYHGALCHDMSYVTAIMASILLWHHMHTSIALIHWFSH